MNPIILALIAGAAVLLLSSFSSGKKKPPIQTGGTQSGEGGFLGNIGGALERVTSSAVENETDPIGGTDFQDLRVVPGGMALDNYIGPGGKALSIIFGPLGVLGTLIVAKQRKNEAERVQMVLNQMKSQNWFKVKLDPKDYIQKNGKAFKRAGIRDVLEGNVKGKYLPPMIAKVSRYINREDITCNKAKSRGAERACRRYYVTARVVRQFLEDELNEIQ